MKTLFQFVLGLFIIIICAAGAFLIIDRIYNDESKSSKTINNQLNEREKEIKDRPKNPQELTQAAWIPYWDYKRGLETLKSNPGKFDSISPIVYNLNQDGSLKQIKGDAWKPLQQYAKESKIEFIPSIAMFDHELFTGVLQDEENFQRHINSIVSEVEKNNFDGIDLDYESTKLDDKDQYEKFIKELSAQLKTHNAKLVITVLPKWFPEFVYPSLNETRAVQNWEYLGKYADEIRIMAYDYTSQYSEKPGPIAPVEWIKEVLDKAEREIPREKTVLGLHNYGYNWAASEVDPSVNFLNNPPTDKIRSDAYTYDEILEIKKAYGGQEYLQEEWQEIVLDYKREGNDRILVYPNAQTIQVRRDLAAEYGIKGVSFWRLGKDQHLNY